MNLMILPGIKHIPVFFILVALNYFSFGQVMPSAEENISYLVTFSKSADKTWGDDDNIQIYFFTVPEAVKKPFYIRVFDPDNGGTIDENRGGFNSKTRFSVYGGIGAHSNKDAIQPNPVRNFKSGVLLNTKTFGEDKGIDNSWYSFGPFNALEGELQPELGGYVFKLVVEGLDGDDGNLYKLGLSSDKQSNTKLEGGNILTYEYCFRTSDQELNTCHLYPFISKGITAIRVNTYDYDEEGIMRIVSIARKGEEIKPSGDGKWSVSEHKIADEEVNTSLDIQFIKRQKVHNNNIVVYLSNQYGEAMPFYTAPIGGVPKYKSKPLIKPSAGK
jgi:hypothetical protein